MDASFGALPALVGVGSNDIYEWAIEPVEGSGRLLYDRILSVDQYKLAYTLYMQELWNGRNSILVTQRDPARVSSPRSSDWWGAEDKGVLLNRLIFSWVDDP